MYLAALVVIFSLSANAAPTVESTANVNRVIKEAENLTLLQDRLSACNVISKALKRNTGATAKLLKDKLFYFAKVFYTDKGYQSYLLGKEMFLKEKYPEAIEKLIEADQLEKSNSEVLRQLSLAHHWNKKSKVALEVNQRALQINPVDDDLIKDRVAMEVFSEDWDGALTLLNDLNQHGEGTALTAYFKGWALYKTGKTEEAREVLEGALKKDKKYPEIYYWLSELETEAGKKQSLLAKYNELCKNKKSLVNERDLSLCSKSENPT